MYKFFLLTTLFILSLFQVEAAQRRPKVRRASQMESQESVKKVERDFSKTLTTQEKKDISYIIKTLSTTAVIKLPFCKAQLERAGDRINHVHPLRFLEYAFSTEELKAGVHAIRQRSWVWGDFFKGLKDSLQEESERDNMKDAYIAHFSKSVGISPSIVVGTIQNRQWHHFFEALLKKVPRSQKTKRYTM